MRYIITMENDRNERARLTREKFEAESETLRRQCLARKIERQKEPKRRRRQEGGPWYDDALWRMKAKHAKLQRAVDALLKSDLISDEAKLVFIRELNKPV